VSKKSPGVIGRGPQLFVDAGEIVSERTQRNHVRGPSRSSRTTGSVSVGEKQLLHELVPTAVSVGFLVNPKNPNSAAISEHIDAAAKSLGLRLLSLSVVSKDEIEPAYAIGREKAIGALLIHGDALLREQTEHLVRMAAHHGIPTMFGERDQAVAGGYFVLDRCGVARCAIGPEPTFTCTSNKQGTGSTDARRDPVGVGVPPLFERAVSAKGPAGPRRFCRLAARECFRKPP
jgi:ABC transporter substrate binding protein